MSYPLLDATQRKQYWDIINQGINDGANSIGILVELEKHFGPDYQFPASSVRRHVSQARKTWGTKKTQKTPDVSASCKIESKGSEDQEIELNAERVVTLDDALAKAGVDLNRWDVDRWVVNSWEVGAKGPDGRVRVTPLWQVKVWLKAKKGWNPSEFRAILVDDLRKLAPSYREIEPTKAEPLLVELSIFDAHFGKLAWSPETGQDYDIRICRTRYMEAARDLLARAADLQPERILYIVGNDFFHVDHKALTTNGTPMDTDGRWQKAFRIGKDVCITIAEEASLIAPVDILVVPGNHDREKAFCLGEVLDARFMDCQRITVTNSPDPYAYYRWGKVLLGFVHGDNHTSDAKRAQLPQTMATDRPVDWSETVWREWHLGHFHSEREDIWKYRTVNHVRDMAVRILPSLSSTDSWHREQGYASVLAAEAHVYHKERGRWGYFVHQTRP